MAVGEVRAELGQVVARPGRGGCRRRRAPPPSPRAWRRRRAASARPGRRRRGAARTGRRRRSPSPGRPENSATGISSIASTPRSTRWSRCSITASKVPAARERADVQLVEDRAGQRRPRQPSIGPGNARGRPAADGPSTPAGCDGERGSGRGGPPSRLKRVVRAGPAPSTAADHQPSPARPIGEPPAAERPARPGRAAAPTPGTRASARPARARQPGSGRSRSATRPSPAADALAGQHVAPAARPAGRRRCPAQSRPAARPAGAPRR